MCGAKQNDGLASLMLAGPMAYAEKRPDDSTAEPSHGTLPPVGGVHVLLIDDDERVLRVTRKGLERRGYRVTAGARAEEMPEALRAEPAGFDVLLTDYNMPLTSGIEVARQARAIRPDLPVGIFSGPVDDTLRTQAELLGVHEVVSKADLPTRP